MAHSRIFHLSRADRSSKVGKNPENPGKNYLSVRKQNLAFPHVTRRDSNHSGEKPNGLRVRSFIH